MSAPSTNLYHRYIYLPRKKIRDANLQLEEYGQEADSSIPKRATIGSS